ncbi:elongator complex protein 2 [Anopheles maculipalpis]|uniref:elongator complex protein 2 n=1 Tax=Anopheles maculipalpis TaxID=1496333 RepID=UPI0021590147|nr:elongator complex protein 2 [Anopheles maculipalpis]
MSVETIYTSAACNRTPDSLDWGSDGLIYFAANNAIAVFDPKYHGSVKIIRTLVGHKARVNTVRVVRDADECHGGIHLVSGSDDGTCILWNTKKDCAEADPVRFVLKGHSKGVTVVDAFVEATKNLIVATGSVDSSIKLWHLANATSFECFQTIDLRSGLTFSMKLLNLARSNATMLAYATDTDVVNLCVRQGGNDCQTNFVQVEQLKGHFDWVRGLDCVQLPDSEDHLLATSSQDTFIRLWRISPRGSLQKQKDFEEIRHDEDITIEERTFTIRTVDGVEYHYALSLESVLQGHEGWVYGVHFSFHDSKLHLLSSSIDKSLIAWTPSESGIWVESVRVGEVGGSSLGFYGGKFSPNGRSIIGHGFQGSFHLWHEDDDQRGLWNPGTILGGHFGGVRDLVWDPAGGRYVMTLSADQTTRIHAPWIRKGEVTWHEIGRPQVHGYDMQCLTLLSRYRLASAAEEKIVRIFQAPSNFVQNFRALCGVANDPEGDAVLKSNPMGASVPSLGLSNKAVFEVEQAEADTRHIKDMYPEHYFTPIALESPPAEETLMQNTLWPEIQKLYGHGNELYAIASSPDGSLIASGCRATSTEQAQILLWDTTTWRVLQYLTAHQLTVTQLAFSPNGLYLLAVSRDRTFSVFHRKEPNGSFELIMRSDKTKGVHTRIIWCCDWSHDSELFATGSRDGKVVAWVAAENGELDSAVPFVQRSVLELKNESITAVAFGRKKLPDDRYLVAVGLESGVIKLYGLGQWDLLFTITEANAHHMTVKRLSFRPHEESYQLASCGEDGFVRVYKLKLY